MGLYFYKLGQEGGGAERMVCTLANALKGRGFETHLFSWDEPGAKSFYPLDRDVKWHCLGFRPGPGDKLRRTRLLARLLRRERIAVLVGFVMSGDKTVYAAAKLSRVKLVAAERNAPSFYRIRYNRLQRWLAWTFLHLADRITVQFDGFMAGYPSSLRGRMAVIGNPVPPADESARPELPGADGRYTLLAVSRLDAVQKQVDCLIEAFALIAPKHPDWDLRIIGGGPQEHDLRDLARKRGLEDRIIFQGTTPRVFAAYRAAHLFAIPSRWEGFPNALAEAMSHGLPAVGFAGAEGVAQLISQGRTGWLSPGNGDAAFLAGVLSEAMADGAERARRGAAAASDMAAYAPEAQFDRWAGLIRSLLTGRCK